MLPDPSAFVDFFRYVQWADLRQLDAADALDDAQYFKDHGFSFNSVHGVLLHLVSAQDVWLARFENRPPRWLAEEPAMRDRKAVRPQFLQTHAAVAEFLARQTHESLRVDLSFTNRAGKLMHAPLWQFLTHVCNHAGVHRGQLNSMLKLSGATPPGVDYTTWFMSQH